MFARLGTAAPFFFLSSCGFDWSLPSPPAETSTSTSGDPPGGSSSSSGQAGSGSTSAPSTGGGATTVGPGAGGLGGANSTGVGAGGTGGAERDACVECADNYVALCCETDACVSELNLALTNPSHVVTWQTDVACYEFDAGLACAACNELCIFQCGDYFPDGYCFDNTWCE